MGTKPPCSATWTSSAITATTWWNVTSNDAQGMVHRGLTYELMAPLARQPRSRTTPRRKSATTRPGVKSLSATTASHVRATRTHGTIDARAKAGINCWADKACQGAGDTARLPYPQVISARAPPSQAWFPWRLPTEQRDSRDSTFRIAGRLREGSTVPRASVPFQSRLEKCRSEQSSLWSRD
jgi:hypothetical protein